MKKVLVAEDEGLLSLVLCNHLKRVGFQVCPPAATGDRAIEIAALEKPDVIVMDIRLAGRQNGLEAVQKIREFLPVPVVFITGYSEETLRNQALQYQPAVVLIKPLDNESIESAIRSLIDG